MNSGSARSSRFPSFYQWSPKGALASGIFVMDLFIPLGGTTGVLYVAVVILSLRDRHPQFPLWTAVGCSTLTIIALFLSPMGGEPWKVLFNRGLALLMIWITTLMGRFSFQQSETFYAQNKFIQAFTATMPAACFSLDRTGTILSWNPAAEQIYGYSKEEAIGASSYDLMTTTETFHDTKNVIDAVFQGKVFTNMIWHDRNKQQKLGWRVGNLFPVLGHKGHVSYVVNINIDITAQKAAEASLQTHNALLEAILNSSWEAINAQNREGKYLLANQAATEVMGQTPESAIRLDDTQIFEPECGENLQQSDAKALSNGQSTLLEESIVTKENSFTLITTKSPLKASDGNTIGLVGISREISEWKQVQQDLLLTDRVFMASPDHISILGRDYKYRRVNPSYERAHGKSSQELVGMSVSDLLGEKLYTETVKPMLDRCFQGEDIRYEAWFTFTDDLNHYMEVSYLPLGKENQDIQEIVVISRDFTDRKESEVALHKSEQRHRSLVQNAPFCIHEIDLGGRILSMNVIGQKMIGIMNEAEIIGRSYLELVEKEDYDRVRGYFAQACQGQVVEFEFQTIQDKQARHYWKCFTPVRNSSEHIASVMGIAEDVTDRKQDQESVMKNERRYRSLVETAGSVILGLTPDGKIMEWNPEAERVYGISRSEILGKRYIDLFISDSERDGVKTNIQQVLTGTSTRGFENSIMRHDGQLRNISWNVDRLLDEKEMPIGIIAVGQDISERKHIEMSLQQSEARLQAILDNSPGLIFLKGLDGRYLHVNRQFNTMFDFKEKEIIGKTDEEIFPAEQATLFKTHDRQVTESQKLLEFEEEASYTDGSHTNIVHKFPLFNDKGEMFAIGGITTDITERKKAEKELGESRRRFQAIFESAGIGIILVDTNGYLVESNKSFQKFLGYSAEELHALTFIDFTHQEYTQTNLSYFQELKRQARDSYSMEKRYIKKNGQGIWGNLTVTPFRHDNGKLEYAIAMVEDITERKTLEETFRRYSEELEGKIERRAERIQELEQRRMHVEKLAALAQIAAGVAHEINNPLASISQSLVLLKRAILPAHPHFRYMAKVEDCISRIAQITKHLYQLYQPNGPTPTPVDIRMCIQIATEIMEERALKYGMRIKILSISEPIISKVSQGELIQVLCNLIHNAIDASNPLETIDVGLTIEPQTLSIFVEDQGQGISPETAPHIFEPFFTTKQSGAEGGMGLGLSISHSLVESMGGILDFSTSIGQGTTFTITLPRT